MKNKYQIPTWVYYLLIIAVILVVTTFTCYKDVRAENEESPSFNAGTFSGAYGMTPTLYDAWSRKASATASGGSSYYPYIDSQLTLTYGNWNHLYAIGSDRAGLEAWMVAGGRRGEEAFIHWEHNTRQVHSGFYRFVPGWNPDNDGNSNYIRDDTADYNQNWSDVQFTIISNAIIEDDSGGMWAGYYNNSGWGSIDWTGATVVLSTSGDADTVMATVDSSTYNRLYLDRNDLTGSYVWYVVDKGSDYRSCAMTDTIARASMYFYCEPGRGTGDHLCTQYIAERNNQICSNHGDTLVRSYWLHEMANIVRAMRSDADAYDTSIYVGVHKDNVFTDCKAGSKMGATSGTGGSCANLLEEEWQTEDGYSTAESLCFVDLVDSTSGINRCIIEGNVGNYKYIDQPRYVDVCVAADMIMYERVNNPNDEFGNVQNWKRSMDAIMLDKGQQLFVFIPNDYMIVDDCPSIKAERFNWVYAYYLVLMGHRSHRSDSAGFIFSYSGIYGSSTLDTLCWWGAQAKYDMGYPTDTATIFQKGGTNRGWLRHYDNGVAVLHPPYSNDDDTVAVYLGGTYYRVLDDGTLDATGVDTCYIANTEFYMSSSSDCADTGGGYPAEPCCASGRIYGGEAGLDSLSQDISNIDSSDVDVIMRDEVTTLYGGVDTIWLMFSRYNVIDSSNRQDSIYGVDTIQFQVSSLGEDSTFYYWFSCVDANNYDTSSMGTIHTISTDTLDQIVTQIDTTTISFAVLVEIYSNIDPPPDSAVLRAGTYKDLDSCIWRDAFYNSAEDTLEATGLLSGWIYFFKVIAWDSAGVYSDTTDWDSVRIETEASQQDSFVIDASFISDTYIDDHDKQYNCGGEPNFEVGRYYGNPRYTLIRAFGIADSLGDDQEMDSACFEITLLSKHAMDTDEWVTFKWYQVLRYWGEGDNTRSTADYGESSWDSASHQVDDWDIDGCGGAGDREAINEDDGIHPDSIRILWNTSNDTTVRLWISLPTISYWDTSGTNYGIALIMTSESADNHHRARFYSAEHATVAYRPKFIGYKHTLGLAAVIRKFWLIRQ